MLPASFGLAEVEEARNLKREKIPIIGMNGDCPVCVFQVENREHSHIRVRELAVDVLQMPFPIVK